MASEFGRISHHISEVCTCRSFNLPTFLICCICNRKSRRRVRGGTVRGSSFFRNKMAEIDRGMNESGFRSAAIFFATTMVNSNTVQPSFNIGHRRLAQGGVRVVV